jgi:hypothetical protein
MDTIAIMFAQGFPWLHLLFLVWLVASGTFVSGMLKSGPRSRKWLLPSLAGLAVLLGLLSLVFGWGGILHLREAVPLDENGHPSPFHPQALYIGTLLAGLGVSAFCIIAHFLVARKRR